MLKGSNMINIYEPKGKAREYSPLALNIYKGCDHSCFYCYVPNILSVYNKKYEHNNVVPRDALLKGLINSCKKYYNTEKQVLLSFTTDPYCKANDVYKLTASTLEILLKFKIPTAILSKGGHRILQDLSIHKKFAKSIKVGLTLTYDNDEDSIKYEPGAALFTERIETLKILKENGITTWVSMEPVIFADQSLSAIKKSIEYVDHYKIGKLNHFPEYEKNINWSEFLDKVVSFMRISNKKFYIKEDLRKYNKGTILNDDEINMDYLNVKKME